MLSRNVQPVKADILLCGSETLSRKLSELLANYCQKVEISPYNNSSRSVSRYARRRKQGTVTIVLLTVVFLFFNIPFCCVLVLDTVDMLSESAAADRILAEWKLLVALVWLYSSPGYSISNAVIYIVRVKELREFAKFPVVKLLNERRQSGGRQSSKSRISENIIVIRSELQRESKL